ncbi:MAG: site-2 protease family protein [Deltaproteobacteria bacterium]|nr:site-2 protease family protein [Deltaproteobacteria bacterium]
MHFDTSTIRDLVVVLVPMILSLSIHEFSHAWSAHLLGDDTAKSQGRMTMNPLAHIDVFGTLLIPAFSVIAGGIGLIGWAKPVPVSPHRFGRSVTMRTGMMLTALAGPASNVVLALLVAGVAMFLFSGVLGNLAAHPGIGNRTTALMILGDRKFLEDNALLLAGMGFGRTQGVVALLLGRIFLMNVGLAVFNMLPVPPLDGSRLLPLDMQEKLARYSMIVFIGFIVVINLAGGVLWVPVSIVGNGLLGLWSFVF